MLGHGFKGSRLLSPKQGYGKQNTMMGKTLQIKTAHLVEPGKQKTGARAGNPLSWMDSSK